MNKWSKTIGAMSAILVFALACAAFRLSYDALNALAADMGVAARLACLFPLVVDGFILVASLSILRATLAGEPTLYPWLLLILFTVLSIAFNVIHAPATWLARVVGAVPPTALALALHLVTAQIEGAIKSKPIVIPTADETAWLPTQRRQRILTLIVDGTYAGSQDAAQGFGVSASTIRGDITALIDAGEVVRKSQGVFVAGGNNSA